MTSRYNVYLNNVALSSLNTSLYVSDISYAPVQEEISVANFAGRSGALVTNRRKPQTTVTVTFELHIYGTQARQNACADVIAWAKDGGILTTSDRADQYLQCVCTKLPAIESALKWTDNLTVEFTAYAIPYWQSVTPDTATVTGSGSLFVHGNGGKAMVNAEITAGASLTALSIAVGDTTIALSNISLSANDVVNISHDANGILSIKKGTTSLLDKRTSASSDDLLAECGATNTVTVSENATAVISVKGVWH